MSLLLLLPSGRTTFADFGSFSFPRTLFYQAQIYCPVPPTLLTNTGTVSSWLLGFQGPPRTLLLQQPGLVQPIGPPPPIPGLTTFIETGQFQFGRTLFYQARVEIPWPVVVPTVVTADMWLQQWQGPPRQVPALQGGAPFVPAAATRDNTPVGGGWEQTLDGWSPFPRPLLLLPGGQPFVPRDATRENTVTPDKWLLAWQGPPRYSPNLGFAQPFVARAATVDNTVFPPGWLIRWPDPPRPLLPKGDLPAQPFVPARATLDNTVTPDSWMPAWQGPPRQVPAPLGGLPFVPRAATIDNTVTPDSWMLAWQGPPRQLQQLGPTQIYAFPPSAVSNLTTTLEWLIAWQGPPRTVLPLGAFPSSPFVARAAVLDNTVTPDAYQAPFVAFPPRQLVAPTAMASPFVPRAATLENTVTPDKWLLQWPGPPRKVMPLGDEPYEPFLPEVAVLENTVTPDKWLIRWDLPPRQVPAPAGGSPFVADQAVVYNTIPTGFLPGPVPRAQFAPRLLGDATFYSLYPPPSSPTPSNLEWLQPFYAPVAIPRAAPSALASPFVPRAATLENTVTPDKWLLAFQGPPRSLLGLPGGAILVAPVFITNLTTTLEWLQAWQGPPRSVPAPFSPLPFVPRAATLDNTVTPDAWQSPFIAFPGRQVPAPAGGQPFVPRAATLDNTVTPDKYQQAFVAGPPRFTPNVGFASPFVPAAATVDNTVTPDKYQQAFVAGPPRFTANLGFSSPFVPPAAVLANTVNFSTWWNQTSLVAPRILAPIASQQFYTNFTPPILNTIVGTGWMPASNLVARTPSPTLLLGATQLPVIVVPPPSPAGVGMPPHKHFLVTLGRLETLYPLETPGGGGSGPPAGSFAYADFANGLYFVNGVPSSATDFMVAPLVSDGWPAAGFDINDSVIPGRGLTSGNLGQYGAIASAIASAVQADFSLVLDCVFDYSDFAILEVYPYDSPAVANLWDFFYGPSGGGNATLEMDDYTSLLTQTTGIPVAAHTAAKIGFSCNHATGVVSQVMTGVALTTGTAIASHRSPPRAAFTDIVIGVADSQTTHGNYIKSMTFYTPAVSDAVLTALVT